MAQGERNDPHLMSIRLATPSDSVTLPPLMDAFNADEGIQWTPDAVVAAFGRLCK